MTQEITRDCQTVSKSARSTAHARSPRVPEPASAARRGSRTQQAKENLDTGDDPRPARLNMDQSERYCPGRMPSDHDPGELVDTLADLARLELPPEEAAQLGAQLETILGYIRSLQSVDVDGVPEYLSAEQSGSGLRDDQPDQTSEFDADRALADVPVLRGRLVAVPKFKD